MSTGWTARAGGSPGASSASTRSRPVRCGGGAESEGSRVSVVTGGALGIGGAISRRLAAGGDLVILNDIDADAAARTSAAGSTWVPLARFGEPDDYAAVVAFLASDDARFVTGHTIPVDGGTLAASGWFVRADDQGWTNRPHRA